MRLLSFSGIALPDYAATDNILAATRTNLVTLRGGVIDQDNGMSYPEVQQFGRQGNYLYQIDDSIDRLRARMLKGAGVLRAKFRDNSERITLAKITQVVTNADVNNYSSWQPYTIRFQQTYPYWMDEADGHFMNSGYQRNTGRVLAWRGQSANIGSSPVSFSIINMGNAPCPMIYIHVVTGATATLNGFMLVNDTNGMVFNYSTALANNSRLIIDTLGRRITNNYADAYNGFSIPDVNQINWMRLEPGTNNFRLLHNGATNTPTITFYFLRHFV